MGNGESQFEEQFETLYNFIAAIDVPLFCTVKIFRKNKFAFDYVMVAEKSLADVEHTSRNISTSIFQEKLDLIRKYQNNYTVQLSYWRILKQHALECGLPPIRLYLQFYNHTLLDYLNALRANHYSFSIDEIIFVLRSLSEAILALRKMKIVNYRITLDNIFVSANEGKVVLHPTYFLFQSVHESSHRNILNSLTKDYQLYLSSNSQSKSSNSTVMQQDQASLQQRQLMNLRNIFFELTRYLSISSLNASNNLLGILKSCRYINQILQKFSSPCEQLNVQQFGQSQEENNLYPPQQSN